MFSVCLFTWGVGGPDLELDRGHPHLTWDWTEGSPCPLPHWTWDWTGAPPALLPDLGLDRGTPHQTWYWTGPPTRPGTRQGGNRLPPPPKTIPDTRQGVPAPTHIHTPEQREQYGMGGTPLAVTLKVFLVLVMFIVLPLSQSHRFG